MSEGTSTTFLTKDEATEMASSERGSLFAASSRSDVGDKLRMDEIERLVQKTLDNLQQKCQFSDANTLMSLVVPKVLYDLHGFDQLHEELQGIKQSLHSYTRHSSVIDEDIAEIFLDLHNIYTKLDKLNERGLVKQKDKKFTQRLREAESFLQSKKHYIENDNSSLSVIPTTLDLDSSQKDENP